MAIQRLNRTFKFKENNLPDPNPKWSEKQVKTFYANEYPELTNANIKSTKQENNTMLYEFETNLGTKG